MPTLAPPTLGARASRRALIALALLAAAWLGSLISPSPMLAQQGARLTIIDDETGDPVPGALVKIRGRPDVAADDNGKVTIADLPVGRHKVEVRAIGYEPREDYVQIQEGQMAERRISLGFTGDQLPELVVEARREKLSGRYQDFHRRQAVGGGHFIMWDEIKRRGYTRLGDALKNVRGVLVNCRTVECTISMSRSRTCPPDVWVDGVANNYFGANTPISDVYGIEVYRGAGEVPAEYIGTAGCGAIVIWTKNRPYR